MGIPSKVLLSQPLDNETKAAIIQWLTFTFSPVNFDVHFCEIDH